MSTATAESPSGLQARPSLSLADARRLFAALSHDSEYTRQTLIESGPLTITVEEAGKFMGVGRGTAYECVRNGEIPSLSLGRKRLVPVPALLRMLGAAEELNTSVEHDNFRSSPERQIRLQNVWKKTMSERERIALYVGDRGLPEDVLDSVGVDVLRFHPALPYFDDEGRHRGDFPAMVAKVTDVEGTVVTLHRTYLAPDGLGKLDLGTDLPAKKLMTPVADGASKGASIKLCPPGSILGFTEGIETALAVSGGHRSARMGSGKRRQPASGGTAYRGSRGSHLGRQGQLRTRRGGGRARSAPPSQ